MEAHQEAADQELCARIIAGDRAAFSQCYQKYFRPLWIFAYGYLGDSGASEDVVQDVFVSLWERREKLDIRTSLTVYLYSAVKRRALTNVRHAKVVARVEESANPVDVAGVSLTDESHADKADIADLKVHLDQALASLPFERREMLRLRWIEGLKFDEIAAIMGISSSGVKMAVQRSVEKLKPLLRALRS